MEGTPLKSKQLFQCALIVEPVASLRLLIAGLAMHAGIRRTVTCTTPVDAMPLMEENHCDLVICSSSHRSGDVLAQCVRWGNDSPNRSVPILLVAKLTTEDVILSARDQGINTVLALPFSGNAFAVRLKSLAHGPRKLIKTPTFIGPDRRIQNRHISFEDRRSSPRNMGNPMFSNSSDEIIRSFIRSRNPNSKRVPLRWSPQGITQAKTGEDQSDVKRLVKEIRCVLSDLQVGHRLTRPCLSSNGLVVVGADHELSNKTILRLVDLVQTGDVENLFFREL